MPRELHRGLLLGLLLLSGCDFYYDKVPSPDDLMKLVPWFDHMIKSPAVHPYQTAGIPRNTPAGTVPVNRTEGDWQLAWSNGNFGVADGLKNPAVDPGATIATGDTLFQVFCTVCHGTAGAGNGPVGPRVGAPSLLTEKARALSDGHIYSVIRYGRGVMPRYGDKIVGTGQRWAIVSYVRKLQGAAGAAAPAPGGAH